VLAAFHIKIMKNKYIERKIKGFRLITMLIMENKIKNVIA